MLQSFTAQFGNQLPTLRGKRVLLACSGGLDSCVVLHLMRQLDCELSIAHVNYNLRGAESIEDADFVKQLAASNDLQFIGAFVLIVNYHFHTFFAFDKFAQILKLFLNELPQNAFVYSSQKLRNMAGE